MVKFYESTTGSRLIMQANVAGFNADMIKVEKAVKDGGNIFELVVKGKYQRPHGETGKLVPRFALDKARYQDGDEKFKITRTLPIAKDFDLDAIEWGVADGVLTIIVPKTALAIGTKIEATAGNIVDVGADVVASGADVVASGDDEDEE